MSVVIAWRDDGAGSRAPAFELVHRFWLDQPGVEVVVVDSDTPEFTSYRAVNLGVEQAGGDVIVQADADYLPSRELVTRAVAAAAVSSGLVYPGHRSLYLEREPSSRVLAGLELDGEPECELVATGGCGGVLVYSRATWEAVSGYDERFNGWGFGDVAFWGACQTLVAAERRLEGDLHHLWHVRDPRSYPGSGYYERGVELLERYRRAAGDREAMLALVKETV